MEFLKIGNELETQRLHHSSEVCEEPHNSLLAFNCGNKGTNNCWTKQTFCRKSAKILGKGKCCYKWQRLPFLFLFVLTSQLLVYSQYNHRLHYPAKAFVIFNSECNFFLEILICGCKGTKYLVYKESPIGFVGKGLTTSWEAIFGMVEVSAMPR